METEGRIEGLTSNGPPVWKDPKCQGQVSLALKRTNDPRINSSLLSLSSSNFLTSTQHLLSFEISFCFVN